MAHSKRIRALLDEWFRNDLMGVPGDEDGGGMTAFVVFSEMGFYPVTPGSPSYNIGSPCFPYVKLSLWNGKYFEIKAQNASFANKYIQSARLNGKPLNRPWFNHSDIANGGVLEMVMGQVANKNWGVDRRRHRLRLCRCKIYIDEEEAWAEVINKVEANAQDYIKSEGMSSHEGFKVMEDFIAGIKAYQLIINLSTLYRTKSHSAILMHCYSTTRGCGKNGLLKSARYIDYVKEQIVEYA